MACNYTAIHLILFYLIFFLQQIHSHKHKDATIKEFEAEFAAWMDHIAATKQETTVESPALNISEIEARLITVDKKGYGNFLTVQAAVDSIKTGNTERVVIYINEGIYEEKVKVPKDKRFITFKGAGPKLTIITWHDNASTAKTTFKSATVSIISDYFIARDITFENSAPAPQPGAVKRQAVALQISGDKSVFYNCHFLGAQDTLYDHKGRHYFHNCFIQGSIDFIFGNGLSLYMGCELNAIASYGSVTAQKRSRPGENTGFSFVNCKIHGLGILYLGRAWGPYSRVVYISSKLDIEVAAGGWYDWGDKRRERTVFYGEYNCSGNGAKMKGMVAWSHHLSPAQAAPFMSLHFIDGQSWIQV